MRRFSSAFAALERRLRVVESDGPVGNAITGFDDEIDPGLGPVPAGLACDMRGAAGAFEEAVHAAGPVFLPDVDQGLEVAPVIGVAGRVTHAFEGKVTGGIVMNEDACDVPVDIAVSGADAQDGQERGAQHVEPTGATFDADSGFVEVSDRATVRIRSAMSSNRCAVRRLMAAIVVVEIGTANRSLIRSASLF